MEIIVAVVLCTSNTRRDVADHFDRVFRLQPRLGMFAVGLSRFHDMATITKTTRLPICGISFESSFRLVFRIRLPFVRLKISRRASDASEMRKAE